MKILPWILVGGFIVVALGGFLSRSLNSDPSELDALPASTECKDLVRLNSLKDPQYLSMEVTLRALTQEAFNPSSQEATAINELYRRYESAFRACNLKNSAVKLTAEQERGEIRNGFHNGLLGHIGNSNEERERLLFRIARLTQN